MARKAKRARSSGGNRSPRRARKSRSGPIVHRTSTVINVKRRNGLWASRSRNTSWTLRRFSKLSEEQRDTYFRAKRVIDEARAGKSPTQAARDNKTTLATARRYFATDFTKLKGSRRWKVSSSDKHPNQVQWLGKNGYEDFVLRGSRDVSRLGTYLNDVKRALRGDDPSVLDKWRGRKIGGRKLITNLKMLTALADAGKLDWEDEQLWRS